MAGENPNSQPRDPQVALSTRVRASLVQRLLHASVKLTATEGKKISQAAIVDAALDEWLTQHDL